ncbi:hypothetical protein E2C01_063771 [Portunus trituberculatus]|uniref:Uncharacterized protein n=1 Tax=Portunus trituberculatus TaxID=210409 RepID=A0A5B7HHA2_PORTR|nr:hypothetical protein [Portunus trituberculatus]
MGSGAPRHWRPIWHSDRTGPASRRYSTLARHSLTFTAILRLHFASESWQTHSCGTLDAVGRHTTTQCAYLRRPRSKELSGSKQTHSVRIAHMARCTTRPPHTPHHPGNGTHNHTTSNTHRKKKSPVNQ